MMPTLGPNVCKQGLLWAICSPRVIYQEGSSFRIRYCCNLPWQSETHSSAVSNGLPGDAQEPTSQPRVIDLVWKAAACCPKNHNGIIARHVRNMMKLTRHRDHPSPDAGKISSRQLNMDHGTPPSGAVLMKAPCSYARTAQVN